MLAFIYGGLTLEDLKIKNQKLEQKQITLEEKIADLETRVIQTQKVASNNQQAIQNYQAKIDDYQKQITDYQNTIAYYKKQASAPKAVSGVSTTVNQNPPATAPTTQTVTNTITEYVQTPLRKQASVIIDSVGSYKVDISEDETAFSLLKKTADQKGFDIEYTIYEGLGAFITSIAGIKPQGNQYWAFYYNGKYSMVGASSQKITPDDTTFWRLESF